MAAPVTIDSALVARLLAAQFPDWAELPLSAVEAGGWDNRSFRLGSDLLVRLPSALHYASQVPREQEWLPRLAPHLPVAIPTPVARGVPGEGYPWHWSVYRWIEGETLSSTSALDQIALAQALAGFLAALHRIDTAGGPPPSAANFHRGGSLAIYASEVLAALERLGPGPMADAAKALWDEALASDRAPQRVWVHGDVAPTNLLVRDGALCAVIDFGNLAVGDPACDLAIAWTFLGSAGRAELRRCLPLDAATWARGRAWALWKALILTTGVARGSPQEADAAPRVLAAILNDAA